MEVCFCSAPCLGVTVTRVSRQPGSECVCISTGERRSVLLVTHMAKPVARQLRGRLEDAVLPPGLEANGRGLRMVGEEGEGILGRLSPTGHTHASPPISHSRLPPAFPEPAPQCLVSQPSVTGPTFLAPAAAGEKPPDTREFWLWLLLVSSFPFPDCPALGVTSHLLQQDMFSGSWSAGTPVLQSPPFWAPPQQLLSRALCPSPSPQPSTLFRDTHAC